MSMAFGDQFVAAYANRFEAAGRTFCLLLEGSARIGKLQLDAGKALLQSLEDVGRDAHGMSEHGNSPLAQAMLLSHGLARGTRWLQACFVTTAKLNADVNAALWDQARTLGGTLVETLSAGSPDRGTPEPEASTSFAERRTRRAA